MKKNLLLGLFAVAVATASSVSAIELKTPNVSSLTNTTAAINRASAGMSVSDAKGMIANINAKLNAADKSLQGAFTSLVSAVSSKEEAQKLIKQLNAINNNKNLSETEKSAKLTTIVSDYGKTLEENQEKYAQNIKNASAEKNANITAAIIDLSNVGKQYLDIAASTTPVVLQISKDPKLAVALAPEITNLKELAIQLKNNAQSLKNVTTQAVAVAKAGGVEVKLPKQSASKAKKVDLK